MKLLQEGMAEGLVKRTTLTRKCTIDGLTRAYPVYKVRLNCLFYNERNDRIASWISQYKDQHGGAFPSDLAENKTEYNAIISAYITDSNPELLRKTQINIKMIGQRESGVTLNDGRIIDGNRRFTCLRNLAAEDPEFDWFETIILDRDFNDSAKQIKMLELMIQHGEESKVEYNPVDRLVGIYQDIVETELLTPSEYAASVNEPLQEVQRKIEVAKLMEEFLEYLRMPKQFHIVREMQIAAALEELPNLLKKTPLEERESVKQILFANLLMKPSGDNRIYLRRIKSVVDTPGFHAYLEEQEQLQKDVQRLLLNTQCGSAESLDRVVQANRHVSRKMEASLEKTMDQSKRAETKGRPLQFAEKATALISGIDTRILIKLDEHDRAILDRQLSALIEKADQVRQALKP